MQVEDSISIDEALIQQRTCDLQATSEHIPRAHNLRRRAEVKNFDWKNRKENLKFSFVRISIGFF